MANITVQDLFDSIQKRLRPEDVAEMILKVNSNFTDKDRRVLEKASNRSLENVFFGYTSMLQDFRRPDDTMRHPFMIAKEICGRISSLKEQYYYNPDKMSEVLDSLCGLIHKSPGKSSFRDDRLNKDGRKRVFGKERISRRRYNKLFRLFSRMEIKLDKLRNNIQRLRFTQIGKSGLVTDIPFDLFSNDIDAACFIAYFVSRSNLRSTFTNQSQVRPYDQICEMLMARCRKSRKSKFWQAIAMVYPDQAVLNKLSPKQKGDLMGKWMNILQDTAICLRDLWSRDKIDLKTMIVRRGNDSSTWNLTASAWNKARANWISLVHNMGMSEMLVTFCPGKVMRLMAADVAYWHRSSGGDVDPNTNVWNRLPKPWEVILGESKCTERMVKMACKKAGLVADQSGWTQPLPKGKIVQFAPTPELVHGVAVASPHMASILKKCGYFSGKTCKGGIFDANIERNEEGFALGVL